MIFDVIDVIRVISQIYTYTFISFLYLYLAKKKKKQRDIKISHFIPLINSSKNETIYYLFLTGYIKYKNGHLVKNIHSKHIIVCDDDIILFSSDVNFVYIQYYPGEKLSVLPRIPLKRFGDTLIPHLLPTITAARMFGNLCPGLTVFSGVLFPAFSFPQIPVGVAMDIKHV